MRRILPLLIGCALVCCALPAEARLHSCGNGIVNSGEQCDDGNHVSTDGCTTICRIAEGWTCTGRPSVCTQGIPLMCGNGVVQEGETCDDGNTDPGDGCQGNCKVQSGWECTGSPSLCAPSEPIPSECGNGAVEIGEECDDANVTSGDGCLSDCTLQFGWVCIGSPSLCTPTVHAAGCGNGVVEQGEECDDANVTSGDGCLSDCTVQPGWECTGSPSNCAATEPTGNCNGQPCHQICRSSRFWSMRAGRKPSGGDSLIQSVLDQVGSLSVCGRAIVSASDVGNLGSALEALCVRPQGVDERDLFRELVTTALNCAVSEGGTCDEIVGSVADVSFDDCNALCAGQPVSGGPTVEECIDRLSCFNRGGHDVAGQCATGTCADGTNELCGGELGPCNDNSVECLPFDGSCATQPLCSTNSDADAQICPHHARPSGQKLCQEARKNSCTIDACD